MLVEFKARGEIDGGKQRYINRRASLLIRLNTTFKEEFLADYYNLRVTSLKGMPTIIVSLMRKSQKRFTNFFIAMSNSFPSLVLRFPGKHLTPVYKRLH